MLAPPSTRLVHARDFSRTVKVASCFDFSTNSEFAVSLPTRASCRTWDTDVLLLRDLADLCNVLTDTNHTGYLIIWSTASGGGIQQDISPLAKLGEHGELEIRCLFSNES